jgi:hypothetical protein
MSTPIVVVAIYSERWNFAPNCKKKKTLSISTSPLCQVATPNCQLHIAKLATPANPLHYMYTLQIAHKFFLQVAQFLWLIPFLPKLMPPKDSAILTCWSIGKGGKLVVFGGTWVSISMVFLLLKKPFQTIIDFFSTLLSEQFERSWIQFFLTFSTLVIVCSVVHNLRTWCQNSQVIYLNPKQQIKISN